ncbi:alkaline phosphatase family protein [Microbacterium azadirachtae]|uniref:phospholipase C n=1 Tax=Microbacterium azadirachtae TaxID=582680 RepID=A0A0F0LRI8_9MICO|nr:alkaline phosphatase family protein [Microbacterium azadirachtae]KJL34156.1 Phospholipase C 2 precursor [Microbacterium azadirachtae]
MHRRKNSPASDAGSAAPESGPADAPESTPDTTETGADGGAQGGSRSRRDFLRIGGLTAAGAVVGGGAGAAIGYGLGQREGFHEAMDDYGALAPRHAPGFDHIVVLMGENRSFDNLLGYLYTKDDLPEGQEFDGLAFGEYYNELDGQRYDAHVYEGPTDTIMTWPDPDPGEMYPHVNTQLYNTIDPASNAELYNGGLSAPYNEPAAGTEPTMTGFVTDYMVNVMRLKHGKSPTQDELSRIMGSFSPEMLPTVSTLAREFAVFDHWFCAVPSQTFCNRSFFNASTSHGQVTNHEGGDYAKWLDAPKSPTIFNRLEESGLSWKIYFDEVQMVSFTGVLHAPVLEEFWRTEHFGTMDDFYADVEHGELPAYAFVEPRMIYDHNDFHPPFGSRRETDLEDEDTALINSAYSDVRAGDDLVHDIYDAIRTSKAPKGSNAINTLLLITFDEHGGTYDHVAPPKATPPDNAGRGEMGFAFDRLGCRVPAIAVSAYTRKGTVINDQMHHGSVIATLTRLHGLKPLTRRDATANDLFQVVNLDKPRHPSDWPVTQSRFLPPNPESKAAHPAHAHAKKPLTPPAEGLLGLLLARYGLPGDEQPQTFMDAYNLLHKHGKNIFGPPDQEG